VDFLHRSKRGRFAREIGERAVALSNEKQRIQVTGLFADVVDKAHEVCLTWKIADPNGMSYQSRLDGRPRLRMLRAVLPARELYSPL
jgi:hypothetical protein